MNITPMEFLLLYAVLRELLRLADIFDLPGRGGSIAPVRFMRTVADGLGEDEG